MVRTEPKLIGGIAGKATAMSKGQVKFTDLKGEDIGALFSAEFKEQLDWPAPVAISNDTVMALHYFLGPDFRPNINNAGLFISGTGTNFAMAEPHAVRSNGFNIGFISKNGEDYQPRRLHSGKDLEEGEISLPFIVNYESGTTELLGTRTRFDTQEIFPIERNALAGGNAFPQQLRQFSQLLFSEEFYRKIQKGWALASGCEPSVEPGAPAVGEILACDGYESLLRMLGDAPLEPTEAAGLRLIAKTIVDRSAMHAALILYAITLRTGFGKGGEGKPDLVGMEGSVWKIRGYSERVKNWWQSLLGEEKLHVIFEKEPSCNASLPGPLYMAALHRQ